MIPPEEMRFEELQIQVLGTSRGSVFPIQVTSPMGSAEGSFECPFSRWEIDAIYNDIPRLRDQGLQRSLDVRAIDPVKDLGSRFFLALLHSNTPAGKLYGRTIRGIEDSGADVGLRVRVAFDSEEMAVLPWEFLFDVYRQDFLALSSRYVMIRQNGPPRPAPPFVTGALRVLVVTADPDGQLETQAETDFLRQLAQGSSALEIRFVANATLTELVHTMREHRFHILHYAGTGSPYGQQPGAESPRNVEPTQQSLLLRDGQGAPVQVGAGALLKLIAQQRDLRFVYLNACKTDWLAGRLGAVVPATLGIRHLTTPDACIAFTDGFYRAMLSGRHVEAAVAQGRQAIDFKYPGGREWALPIFHMAVPELPLRGRREPGHKAAGANRAQVQRAEPPDSPASEDAEVLRLQLALLQQNLEELELQSLNSLPSSRLRGGEIAQLRANIAQVESELKQLTS